MSSAFMGNSQMNAKSTSMQNLKQMDSISSMKSNFLSGCMELEDSEEEQWEYLTVCQYDQSKKFIFQETANKLFDQYQTESIPLSSLSLSQGQASGSTQASSINESSISNRWRQLSGVKQLSQAYEQLKNAKQNCPQSLQGLDISLGNGSQGSVSLDILTIQNTKNNNPCTYSIDNTSSQGINLPTANSEPQLQNVELLVGVKSFSDEEYFKRELVLLKLLESSQFVPHIASFDCLSKTIAMEYCISSLDQFASFSDNKYLNDDQMVCRLLFEVMRVAIGVMSKGIIHGDIKPSNIAFTLRNETTQLVLLDFAGSSSSINDYGNFYTPAFYSPKILNLLLSSHEANNLQQQSNITLDHIVFNELFAACRTIQLVLLKAAQKSIQIYKKFKFQQDMSQNEIKQLFQFSQMSQFLFSTTKHYPLTASVMKVFFNSQKQQYTLAEFKELVLKYQNKISDQLEIDPNYLISASHVGLAEKISSKEAKMAN